ncbi:hypothetical protein BOTBODRAFT_145813 [Botryobasidium botryosum FD-172 SS1]|uniref:Uncharacterized protein n=1 Tax=Botryobasidium botryosum (strain FD-172 SS1) TaxID=930990 RepID=A0A067MHK9_BOTB1|nr:hypothetical protein BOTBODRAFT_145813 [Botryobasidium botryosum FD-172 SS1]
MQRWLSSSAIQVFRKPLSRVPCLSPFRASAVFQLKDAIRSYSAEPRAERRVSARVASGLSQCKETEHAGPGSSATKAEGSSTSGQNAPLSLAQFSRTAAHAIRQAMLNGDSRRAYKILNLVYSPSSNSPSDHKSIFTANSKYPHPRLPLTATIHSLLRAGLTHKASKLAEKAILGSLIPVPNAAKDDIPFTAPGPQILRAKTMEFIIAALCPTKMLGAQEELSRVAALRSQINASSSSTPHSTHSPAEGEPQRLDKSTRLALTLLERARQHRYRRTQDMYERVIDACLLQGEIITASLLFVLLVRDWQIRQVLKAARAQAKEEEEQRRTMTRHLSQVKYIPRSWWMRRLDWDQEKGRLWNAMTRTNIEAALCMGLHDYELLLPFPSDGILRRIVQSMDFRLDERGVVVSRNIEPEGRSHKLRGGLAHESSTALGHLVGLLRERALPLSQLSPLLSAMYNVPANTQHIVELLPSFSSTSERPTRANLRELCRDTLDTLFAHLPLHTPNPTLKEPSMLPPLDIRSCNTLLHYALKYRHSPDLACNVLEYMRAREPPVKPNKVTHNILAAGATLLRKNAVADHALRTLLGGHANSEGAGDKDREKMVSLLPPVPEETLPVDESDGAAKLIALLKEPTPGAEETDVAAPPSTEPTEPTPAPDSYTINILIKYLVATGNPDAVTVLLPILLPTTASPGRLSASEISKRDQEAASLGPMLYASLLNALQKAGHVGYAERVFRLAKRAERASWSLDLNETAENGTPVQPWCLPIEAYTSMMLCYAGEAKKGLTVVKPGDRKGFVGATLSSTRPQETTGKHHVYGWAAYRWDRGNLVPARRREHWRTRWETARSQGLGLYLAAHEGAQSVHQSLMELYHMIGHAAKADPHLSRYRQVDLFARHPELVRHLRPPVPDARFWNAVLDIYGRWDGMSARGKWRRAQSYWVARAKARRRKGSVVSVVTKERAVLRDIAKDMESVGIQLPLGFQQVLDGLSDGAPTLRAHGVGSPVRSGTFHPFRIPTFKTRGLPIRRSGGAPRQKYIQYVLHQLLPVRRTREISAFLLRQDNIHHIPVLQLLLHLGQLVLQVALLDAPRHLDLLQLGSIHHPLPLQPLLLHLALVRLGFGHELDERRGVGRDELVKVRLLVDAGDEVPEGRGNFLEASAARWAFFSEGADEDACERGVDEESRRRDVGSTAQRINGVPSW